MDKNVDSKTLTTLATVAHCSLTMRDAIRYYIAHKLPHNGSGAVVLCLILVMLYCLPFNRVKPISL